MTANQIAYGQLQVSERMATESERHNKEQERINSMQADTQAMAAAAERQFKEATVQINRERLDLDKAIQEGRLKLDENIQNQYAELEARKTNANIAYQEQMASVAHSKLELEQAQYSLDKDWKQIQAELGVWSAAIEDKRVEYQHSEATDRNYINLRDVQRMEKRDQWQQMYEDWKFHAGMVLEQAKVKLDDKYRGLNYQLEFVKNFIDYERNRITKRGQDINAGVAIRGQDVQAETQRRGQNLGVVTDVVTRLGN